MLERLGIPNKVVVDVRLLPQLLLGWRRYHVLVKRVHLRHKIWWRHAITSRVLWILRWKIQGGDHGCSRLPVTTRCQALMCLLQLLLLTHDDIKHPSLLLLQVLHLVELLVAMITTLLIVVVTAWGCFNDRNGSLC